MRNRSHLYIEPSRGTMTPSDLKAWRQARGLIQRDAGALLGMAKRTYHYLEAGETRGGAKLATIPRQAELALKGLDAEMIAAFGVTDADGLRAAYARAVITLEQASSDHRHKDLGEFGKVVITKKRRV